MLSESTATESEEKCFLLRDNCSTKDHCQYSMSPIKRGEKKGSVVIGQLRLQRIVGILSKISEDWSLDGYCELCEIASAKYMLIGIWINFTNLLLK